MNRLALLAGMYAIAMGVNVVIAANDRPEADVAVWNFDKDTAGWKAAGDCTLKVSGGVLTIAATGNDPHLAVRVKAPSGWKEFSFRARFSGRYEGQLFWTTNEHPGTSEEQSVPISIRSRDDQWHDYHVYFKPTSELTGLRFDPNNRKGKTEIQWIALANRQPPPPAATPVDRITTLPDFEVELLYSVPPQEQGSWVSLTTDPKGRLLTSDQYGKLYRITPPPVGQDGECKIETIDVDAGMAHGLLYAFGSLYVMTNGPDAGLYRVRDTNGDDQFDEVKKLRAIPGAGEHGPHAIILSPDGNSLYVCAGNHTDLPKVEKSLVPRNWQEDILHERMWDAGGHAVGRMAPGGWIARTDPDGEVFELVSIGYRNEYDIAFNTDGELFTYDADMEWDIGAPWYRPTRVNHATSGSEFGWRSGTGKWPAYYPDSLPAVVDIGPGSPTGITFGTGAKLPAKFQQALFICDWSYGKIYAVHLTPDGSTYTGTIEPFVSAAPLPVTDIVVNPHDGALYFTIGGRRTQSGLYRVTYTGDESTAPVKPAADAGSDARALRRELEALHYANKPEAVEKAWPHLSSGDRFIRYAARIAIEHQPVASWQDRALDEKHPLASITALVALARNGDKSLQPKIVAALGRIDWDELDEPQQLALLRAYGLTFVRLGPPSEDTREAALKALDSHFPADSQPLNRELCQLLVHLKAPGVVQRTLALLEKAPTQEEQTFYVLLLRKLDSDWTMAEHTRYFEWFNRAAAHRGGHSFSGFLQNIRKEAIASLTDKEKLALDEVLKAEPQPVEPVAVANRPFVKKWTVADLLPDVEAGLHDRNFSRGREMFAATSCFKCHRFSGQGGTVGPDLSAVGTRFNSRDLLDALIEPSKTVSDQYQATTFLMEDGRAVSGRVANLSNNTLMVMENMLDPGKLTPLNRDEIELMRPSPISQMPEGLLDTLNKEEILDLIAYLRSGGDPKHEAFGK